MDYLSELKQPIDEFLSSLNGDDPIDLSDANSVQEAHSEEKQPSSSSDSGLLAGAKLDDGNKENPDAAHESNAVDGPRSSLAGALRSAGKSHNSNHSPIAGKRTASSTLQVLLSTYLPFASHSDPRSADFDSENEDEGNGTSEDESDSDNEIDQIGSFKFATKSFHTPSFDIFRPSGEFSNWLFQRYLAPHGEPGGIIPADEPTNPPSVSVASQQSASITDTSALANTVSDSAFRAQRNRNDSVSLVEVTDYGGLMDEETLRRRITKIRNMNLSERERDREVQRLMTERYYRLRARLQGDSVASPVSDSPTSSMSNLAVGSLETGGEPTEADRKPSYDPKSGRLGCQHYLRGNKLQCFTCLKWYVCRLCHDEQERHQLIRPLTKNMLCMSCGKDQPVGQNCKFCKRRMARYYCDICKLWDDDSLKSIYHCDACGICRIGRGLGNDFFHCPTCNVCMSIELMDNHRCIEHSTECDCPICGEFMFTSTETVVFMVCGHSMHQSCYQEHTKTSYRCPTCSRSIVNMQAQFRILDAEIAADPLPEPYKSWRSVIGCNDCHAKSMVNFHFLGLKCANCHSYNTIQKELIKPEESESTDANGLVAE